jgi:hypothetical protein
MKKKPLYNPLGAGNTSVAAPPVNDSALALSAELIVYELVIDVVNVI